MSLCAKREEYSGYSSCEFPLLHLKLMIYEAGAIFFSLVRASGHDGHGHKEGGKGEGVRES